MLSMSKLRDRQKGLLWTLLFFFIASMTVGGLVGGANIMDVIKSAFGGIDTRLYVGRIDDENIPISYYLNERQNQINRFRQQGRSIDGRTIQNAGDFAWNTIVERKIKDEKIKEFNIEVQSDEIYDFLLLTPPLAFQNNLKDLGLYKDEEGNFILEDYQSAVQNGSLPDTTNQLLILWERYLKTYLADRKLQNIYNNSTSINDEEVKLDYLQNNINCKIDVLSIEFNSIDNDLIEISDEEISNKYNIDKEEKYKLEESVTVQYILFENIDQSGLDSTAIVEKQDSLLQLAIDFSSDAEIMSFKESLEEYNLQVTDTIDVTESFTNNSGIPFNMGVLRSAVRFAFDNNIGQTSEPFNSNNGLAIFNILNKNSSSYKSLEESKAQIKRSLIRDKKKEFALSTLKNVNLNDDWDSISKNNDLISLNQDLSSNIGGSFQTIGRSNELSAIILEMNINDQSHILESSSHYFVFKLKEIDTFDEAAYNDLYDSLKTQVLNRARNQSFNSWLNNEKKNADIKDLRFKIF